MYKFFIKFGKKEHLENLQNGELFLGTPEIYENFQGSINNKGVQNKYERKILNNVSIEEIKDAVIFCLSQINVNDYLFNPASLNYDTSEFGEYALIINKEKFINNIYTFINKNDIINRAVIYTDNCYMNLNPSEKIQEAIDKQVIVFGDLKTDKTQCDAIFIQNEKHKHQKEYRFWFKKLDLNQSNEIKDRILKINPLDNYSILININSSNSINLKELNLI